MAGASEGLGAAFARELAARGMNVVLIARRRHLLAELREHLTSTHRVEVRCLVLDLADPSFAPTVADAVTGLDLGVIVYN